MCIRDSLYAVFQLSAHTEIQADALAIFIVFDIADKSQVAIGYLGSVFGLHDPVIDPEYIDTDFDLSLIHILMCIRDSPRALNTMGCRQPAQRPFLL